jgi:hypothetical protein
MCSRGSRTHPYLVVSLRRPNSGQEQVRYGLRDDNEGLYQGKDNVKLELDVAARHWDCQDRLFLHVPN